MNLFCIICAHPYPGAADSLLPEYKDTCPKCRKILMEESPGISLYGTSQGYSIDSAIEELEHRIPGLFSGPECPLEFSLNQGCDCTYETGCRALKMGERHTKDKRFRKIKAIQKNDKRS